MQLGKDLLLEVFNHKMYPVGVALALVAMAFVFAADGIRAVDLIILVVITVLSFGLWRLLLTKQTGPDSVTAIRQMVRDGKHPTLIEFYSAYCVGCMAIKPVVDQLEVEAGDRLRVIRLNIDTEPGKTLMVEHKVTLTPHFVYYDEYGNIVRHSIFVVDKARILYDLEHA